MNQLNAEKVMGRFILIIIIAICYAISNVARAQTDVAQVRLVIKQVGGIEKFLRIVAEQSHKSLPLKIDKETEVYSITAIDKTLEYYSRYINYLKKDLKYIEVAQKSAYEEGSRAMCTTPFSRLLIMEYGVTYAYTVYDKTKEFLFNYKIDKNRCASL